MTINFAPSLSEQLKTYKLMAGEKADPVKIKQIEYMIRCEKIRLFFEKRFYKKATQGIRSWHPYAIKCYEKAGGDVKWF